MKEISKDEFTEWLEKRYGDKEQVERPKSDAEILSEIRSEYNCFNEEEEQRYWALSRGIQALLHEPKHGRWEPDAVDKWVCSECGTGNRYAYSWNIEGYKLQDRYCPNCGAKMDGGEE